MFKQRPIATLIPVMGAIIIIFGIVFFMGGSNKNTVGDQNFQAQGQPESAPTFAVPELPLGPIMAVLSMVAAFLFMGKRQGSIR